MSTPQWFAEFERQEAMRDERIDIIRGDMERRKSLRHFGDPCVHCGITHDDVAPGPCLGDPTKAVVVAYCVWRQAYQNPGSGCDTIRCAMSDGTIKDDARHPAEHWPYNVWFARARVLSRTEFQKLYPR